MFGNATNLVKSHLPRRLRSFLWHALKMRARGKPFVFSVSPQQATNVLNCCVAFNEYGAYCVPISGLHRPAARAVLAGRVWEAETIELIAANCHSGDVIHAGTFFGDFLPALSRAVAQQAQIWAFEPHPESYRCAEITIRLNTLTNVVLANAGLGNQSEVRSIAIHDFDGVALGGASQILPEFGDQWHARGSATAPVHILRLDDVVPEDRRITVIQLDVEGFEQRALEGALRLIRRNRPLLILETLPDPSWLSEHLFSLGYRVGERFLENVVVRCESN